MGARSFVGDREEGIRLAARQEEEETVSMVYGRLTPYELDKQGSDPFIMQGGRRYRITELVTRMDGGANYQAVEIGVEDLHDTLLRVADQKDEPPAAMAPVPVAPVPGGPEVEQGARARIADPEPPLPDDGLPPSPPSLKDWARTHGWRGVGPISAAIRQQYRDEFGKEAYRLSAG